MIEMGIPAKWIPRPDCREYSLDRQGVEVGLSEGTHTIVRGTGLYRYINSSEVTFTFIIDEGEVTNIQCN